MHALGTDWVSGPSVGCMTVRRSIDKLIAEPAIADLGYPADQRLVATVILGLKLLADSIDDIEARLTEMTRAGRSRE